MTTATARPTFLGIDVHGDIGHTDGEVEQKPLEELAPVIQAMLDDPTVVEFGWRQYTPYFNDGDACIFRTTCPWVRLDTDDPELEGGWELEIDSHKGLGRRPVQWIGNERHVGDYVGPDEPRLDRCLTFGKAIDSGHFNRVLIENFGDHANVTVRRDGIQVDLYEHD